MKRFLRAARGAWMNLSDPLPTLPNTIPPEIIGYSVEQRPLYAHTFGTGQTHVLFTAGIHGNEVGTVKLARHLIRYFSQQLPNTKYTATVIPCLNPDGYARAKQHPDYLHGGRIGRFNAHDVDLNRNFDTPSFQQRSTWGYGKNYSEKQSVFCGERGNSEPETMAFTNWVLQKKIACWYMFHNAGRDVMGNNTSLGQDRAKQYAVATNFRFVEHSIWKTLKQTGTAKEWSEQYHIPYIEIEGSNRWTSDWNIQRAAIQECLMWAQQDSNLRPID